MKGLSEEPSYILELLEEGVTIDDVIDGYISEHALVERSAFVVGDLGALMRQHVRWQTLAPQLQPYYPVKCNSSPAVIEVLASLGLGFVCANKCWSTVYPQKTSSCLGFCKQLAHIKYAAKNNVRHLVCDNQGRALQDCPGAQQRKLTTEAHAAETSVAFGCSLKSCRYLLELARELGVDVVGVTFHIPPSCPDLQQAYSHALSDARCVFDMGAELGFSMNILDIGGGITGSDFQLQQVECAVSPLLDAYFPPLSGVQVLAQPGTFYVASAFSLAVNVIGKKILNQQWDSLAQGELSTTDADFQYYINEGVYGSFRRKLLGATIPAPSVHKVISKRWVNGCLLALCSGHSALRSWCIPAACGGRRWTNWMRWWSTACCLSSVSGDWLLFSNMGANGLEELTCLASEPQLPVYNAIYTADWYGMQEAGVALDGTMKNFSLINHSAVFSPPSKSL
ncbi:Antizyme inhibitor 1 [Merluccius polli]|uniref:Antizyme inhibitor 1 n=1 Tax=Merluccius polli TaxID=89951 RepID=A0AA47MZY2_MERPO|nr:Antizyme inhibitor 1 [Merluccius polli]